MSCSVASRSMWTERGPAQPVPREAVRPGQKHVASAARGRGEAGEPAVELVVDATVHDDTGPDDGVSREPEVARGHPLVRRNLRSGSRQPEAGHDRAIEHEVALDRPPVFRERHGQLARAEERLRPRRVHRVAADRSEERPDREVAVPASMYWPFQVPFCGRHSIVPTAPSMPYDSITRTVRPRAPARPAGRRSSSGSRSR